MRAVVAAGAVSQPMSAAPRFGVLSDIGTPSSLDAQQIADQRRTISAFGVGLAPGAAESPPEIVPAPAFRDRATFDSGRDIVETGTAWCLPCCSGACCFIFAS